MESFVGLLDTLRSEESDTLRIGCALHSLRAVPHEPMRDLLEVLPADMVQLLTSAQPDGDERVVTWAGPGGAVHAFNVPARVTAPTTRVG